jgi:hypothetical protein
MFPQCLWVLIDFCSFKHRLGYSLDWPDRWPSTSLHFLTNLTTLASIAHQNTNTRVDWIRPRRFTLGIRFFSNFIRVNLAELWIWSSILPMSSSDDYLYSSMWGLLRAIVCIDSSIFLTSNFNISMVLDVKVQIHEPGTIWHTTCIRPNSLIQGHRDFVRPKKHVYSGDSISLVGSTHRLNYSLYYELLCINLQFDHRFLSVSVLTISFTLRSLGVWLSTTLQSLRAPIDLRPLSSSILGQLRRVR